MRTFSSRSKISLDKFWSRLTTILSIILARANFINISNKMTSATPEDKIISVYSLWVGMTRSYTCMENKDDANAKKLIINEAITASTTTSLWRVRFWLRSCLNVMRRFSTWALDSWIRAINSNSSLWQWCAWWGCCNNHWLPPTCCTMRPQPCWGWYASNGINAASGWASTWGRSEIPNIPSKAFSLSLGCGNASTWVMLDCSRTLSMAKPCSFNKLATASNNAVSGKPSLGISSLFWCRGLVDGKWCITITFLLQVDFFAGWLCCKLTQSNSVKYCMGRLDS